MAPPPKRKPDKSAGFGRRVSVDIRKNIPFNTNEVVTRTQVARKVKKRVLTKSTKVVVPIVPSTPSSLPDLPSLDHSNPQTPNKPTRKGPSRSVAVRTPLLYSAQRADHCVCAQSNLEQWLQYRDEFADEFIKLEALYLGDNGPSPCQGCGSANALFRCLDCYLFGPTCQGCTVHQHANHIFHKLQVTPLPRAIAKY